MVIKVGEAMKKPYDFSRIPKVDNISPKQASKNVKDWQAKCSKALINQMIADPEVKKALFLLH